MFASLSRGSEDELGQDASFVLSDYNSTDADSESDLREVEDLLYSQVHFMSNTSYKDINGTAADEIVVTLVGDERNQSENSTKDSIKRLEETPHCLPGSCDNLHLKQIHGDFVGKLKSEAANESVSCVDLCEETVSLSATKLKSLTAAETNQLSPSIKCMKSSSRTSVILSDKKTVSVSSSSSDSSYDAFFIDTSNSSLDSNEADKGDTRINFVPKNSSDAKLKNVLKSLPDCVWDSKDHEQANDESKRLKGASRYYQMKAFCLNCRVYGHLAIACTFPKKLIACLLCGKRGHMARSCSESLCFQCNLSGHSARDCPNRKWRYERCLRCGLRGHLKLACPDLWRQYHLTTNGTTVVTGEGKSNSSKYCYNCAGQGHFGHECEEERMDRRSSTSFPFIVKYDTAPGSENNRSYNSSSRLIPAKLDRLENRSEKFNPQSRPARPTTSVDLRDVISLKNSQKSNGPVCVNRTTPAHKSHQVERDFPRNPSRLEKSPAHDKSRRRKSKETYKAREFVDSNHISYETRSSGGQRELLTEHVVKQSESMQKSSVKRKHDLAAVVKCDLSPSKSSCNNSLNGGFAGFQMKDVKTVKEENCSRTDPLSGRRTDGVVAETRAVGPLSSEERLQIKLAKRKAKIKEQKQKSKLRKEQKKKRKLKIEKAKLKMETLNGTALKRRSETSVKQKSPKAPVTTARGFRLN